MNGIASGAGVLCVGRLYCDLIFTDLPRLPSYGTEVFADGLSVHPGGGAFITAAHLTSLGHRASLAATLPVAPFARQIMPQIEQAHVSLDLCLTAEVGAAPQITVALVGSGDRAFVTHRSGPACPQLSLSDLGRSGSRHLHIGELTTLIEMPQIVSLARDAGMTISLDCGWDEALTAKDIGTLIADVDVFLPNEMELKHLRALGIAEPFAPLTVVKRGAKGASAMQADQTTSVPAKTVRVVDTTGAGDAFNAGFLSAWLAGAPVAAALEAGNAQGAKAITQQGGFSAQTIQPAPSRGGPELVP